ncbi:hypothetical protein Psta_1154 [Pirellula staleyi DSM 6068]|uniref:Uncharacterized protein n=1 Tax=Pirellula staleyi (strain ATCC 27377 / DSM 6068 / ICPB 4128) TaxID=530564 RepID=D2R909_PIRSD|nr:hypothetical protein [Pirellula staleyi]ADB15836.1 hypothetical protein Psta_1154 [Pirellula staleyi DSM 6068]
MKWLVPWHPVGEDSGQVGGMEQELKRELSADHPLFGLPVKALARRQDCDDVLFALQDGTGRVAVVHLTWTRNPPERPPWPHTTLFPSLENWAAKGMYADTEEFCE